MKDDPFQLQRFVDEQASNEQYTTALSELRSGQKHDHWMWFVFPQVAGLGRSEMAERFAIGSRAEAEAYLAHPVLGPRLIECADAMLAVEHRTAKQILGDVDASKLRSSATLFAAVSAPGSVFHQVIATYFGDLPDKNTLRFLETPAR